MYSLLISLIVVFIIVMLGFFWAIIWDMVFYELTNPNHLLIFAFSMGLMSFGVLKFKGFDALVEEEFRIERAKTEKKLDSIRNQKILESKYENNILTIVTEGGKIEVETQRIK